MDNDLCWYCERPREAIDHYPAVSRIDEFPEQQGWLVAACARCNMFLSNSHQASLEARKHYVRGWLIEKARVQWLIVYGFSIEQIQLITGWTSGGIRTARNEERQLKEKQLRELQAGINGKLMLNELEALND